MGIKMKPFDILILYYEHMRKNFDRFIKKNFSQKKVLIQKIKFNSKNPRNYWFFAI